jgi:hypothetical protein
VPLELKPLVPLPLAPLVPLVPPLEPKVDSPVLPHATARRATLKETTTKLARLAEALMRRAYPRLFRSPPRQFRNEGAVRTPAYPHRRR